MQVVTRTLVSGFQRRSMGAPSRLGALRAASSSLKLNMPSTPSVPVPNEGELQPRMLTASPGGPRVFSRS